VLRTHTFEYGNPNATQMVEHDGHASGLGDLILRTKYRFVNITTIVGLDYAF
jgi:hypothetical protein